MGNSVLSVLQKNIWVNVYRIVINDPFIIGSNMRTCWLHVLESGVVAVRNIIPCHVSKGCEESSKDSRQVGFGSFRPPSVRPPSTHSDNNNGCFHSPLPPWMGSTHRIQHNIERRTRTNFRWTEIQGSRLKSHSLRLRHSVGRSLG